MPVRAFSYAVDDNHTAIVFWNIRGESQLSLPAGDVSLKLETFDGRRLKFRRDREGHALLPAGERHILTIALPLKEARDLFINALTNQ